MDGAACSRRATCASTRRCPRRPSRPRSRRSARRSRTTPIEGTIAVAERLAEEAGSPVAGGSSDDGGNEGGNGVAGLAIIGGLIVVGGGGALLLSRRAQKRRLEQTAAADRAELDPMVDGLAAQISDLDGDMEMGGERAVAAKADYEAATHGLRRGARDARRCRARRPAQVDAAGDLLEKGLRAARRARAQLDGRPVEEADEEPLLEGLCTFNPQHGKAVTSVSVAGPDGEQAEIPTCQDCADRMNEGRQPDYREVETARGPRVPYWQTPRMGGRGGIGGPLIGGALLGILLGGTLGGGPAYGSSGEDWGGGGDDGGGGDWGGGGDFGGRRRLRGRRGLLTAQAPLAELCARPPPQPAPVRGRLAASSALSNTIRW